jgi:hypothetical protein
VNDEDLLTGWDPDPNGATGISVATWNRVFETLLRCGGNFIVPGTFLFPDEAHVRLASDRGLAVGQHHIEILGLNTYRWDDNVEYSFIDHPDTMIEAWRGAVAQYQDREVVWSVGYRGKHDRPFWRDDMSVADSAAARGRVITEAIQTQVDIIRAVRPDDTIVHHLWMEGVELYEEGSLILPDDVSIVWPDDGFGFVRDGGRVGKNEGAYYHVAMYNRFGNQLTEAVPVERIASELRRLEAAGATTHLIVNVSDIRPCLLTAEAAMEFGWKPPSLAETAQYIDMWADRLHGETVGPVVAALWKRYFAAGWRPTDDRPHRLEDNGYHTFSRMILAELAGGPVFDFEESRLPELVPDHSVYRPFREATSSREAAELLAEGTESVRRDWRELADDVESLLSELEAEDRIVVGAHLDVQVRFHMEANDMLYHVSTAYLAWDQGDVSGCLASLVAADQSLTRQTALLVSVETGRWRSWYSGDIFTNLPRTRRLIRRLLDDGPRTAYEPMPSSHEDVDLHALSSQHRTFGRIKAYHSDKRVGARPGPSSSRTPTQKEV